MSDENDEREVSHPAQLSTILEDQRFVSSRKSTRAVDYTVDTLMNYERKIGQQSSNTDEISHSQINGSKEVLNKVGSEHSAITEVSASTESLEDDFQDNQSIYSDIGSVSSRHSKGLENRQYFKMINKLKNENLVLKESLEKANLTDIITLRTKLRGSRSDIIQLRQYNSELKDRVQVLEGRLFNALSALNNNSTASTESEEVNELMGIESRNVNASIDEAIRPWRSKCSHLSRLVKSYEQKIEVMEGELDKAKRSGSNNNNNNNSGNGVIDKQEKLLMSKVKELESVRATNLRVIQELTEEVRRLSEASAVNAVDASDGEEAQSEDKNEEQVMIVDKPAPLPLTAPASSSYGRNHLIASFALGLIIMLLCSLFVR